MAISAVTGIATTVIHPDGNFFAKKERSSDYFVGYVVKQNRKRCDHPKPLSPCSQKSSDRPHDTPYRSFDFLERSV